MFVYKKERECECEGDKEIVWKRERVKEINNFTIIVMYDRWYIGFIVNYASDMSFYIPENLCY